MSVEADRQSCYLPIIRCAEGALVPSQDYEQFMAAQLALHAEGRCFYSITGYAHVGRRQIS